MGISVNRQQSIDNIWQHIIDEVTMALKQEPMLQTFLQSTVLDHSSMGDSLSFHLANKLSNHALPIALLQPLMKEAFSDEKILRLIM